MIINKMNTLNIKKSLFSLFFVLFLTSKAFAQTSGDFSFSFYPESPSAGESFEISVESYSFDINKSDITFSTDKRVVSSGFGKKKATIVMPETLKDIDIMITTTEGKTFAKNIKLAPRSVTMFYEGLDSYTPYWYSGKRLVAPAGKVRVFTIANFLDGQNNYIKKEDLVYTWEMNDQIIQKSSGVGRDYVDIQTFDELGSEIDIKVSVSPRAEQGSVSSNIIITPAKSQVLMYRETGLFDVAFSNALYSDYKFNQKEFVLVAEPFFFSTDRVSDLGYVWSVNGQKEKSSYKRGFKISSSSGIATISLKLEQAKKLFQEAATSVSLSF